MANLITIYHSSGASQQIPAGDWNAANQAGIYRGWSATKPETTSTSSTPTPTVSKTTIIPTQATSNTQINEIYQKYFGRIAEASELNYWKTQPVSSLEAQLKKDYESATEHSYDGSPVYYDRNTSGNEYSVKDKQRIDEAFSKYGFTPRKEDYNYWSNQNKTNSTGNLEANLSQRFQTTNNISYEDKQRIDQSFAKYGYTPTTDDYKYWSDKNKANDTGNLDANLAQRAKATGQTETQAQTQNQDVRIKTVSNPDAYNSAFFEDSGKGAFVTFQTDPDGSGPLTVGTIYHVDPETKNILPIQNEQALISNFDEYNSLGELLASGKVVSIPTSWINEGYPLAGYKMQDAKYAYQADPLKNVIPPTETAGSDVSLRYGKPLDATNQEQVFRENVAGFLGWLKSNDDSGISDDLINEISKNYNLLAQYTSALTYGGYTQADILKDIKRQQLVKDGNTSLSNVSVFSPNVTADKFYATAEGASVKSNSLLSLPETIGGLSTADLNNTYINLPTEFTDAFTPTIDWTSEEGQAKINEIQSAYHDVITQWLEAKTESEQAAAEQNFQEVKTKIEKSYNIKLSNSALTAWDEISDLKNTLASQGVGNSGMAREALDNYLRRVRRNDELTRDEKAEQEKSAKSEYYQKYATSEEIAALSDEERTGYGLQPTTKVNKDQWKADFLAKYPNEKEEYADLYYNAMYDENGNLRSELYSNLMKNKFMVETGSTFGSIPEGKTDYKTGIAQENYIDEQENETKDVDRQYEQVQAAAETAADSYSATTGTNSSSSSAAASTSNSIVNNNISDPVNTSTTSATVKVKNPVTGAIFTAKKSEWDAGVYKGWSLA